LTVPEVVHPAWGDIFLLEAGLTEKWETEKYRPKPGGRLPKSYSSLFAQAILIKQTLYLIDFPAFLPVERQLPFSFVSFRVLK